MDYESQANHSLCPGFTVFTFPALFSETERNMAEDSSCLAGDIGRPNRDFGDIRPSKTGGREVRFFARRATGPTGF